MLVNRLLPLRRYCTQIANSFSITTPIFYVNAAPHIGHLYTTVLADAIARYESLVNPNACVRLTTGTDEHGSKIQQAAEANNEHVGKYCDDVSRRYRYVFQEANISYVDFIRTLAQRHTRAVQDFWKTLYMGGHIYSSNYAGWYCVADECFLSESQIKMDNTTGIRTSMESGHPLEWTEETNYMFRLSGFQEEVLRWAKQGGRVRPAKFEKILLNMLSEPLSDLSVSRPAKRVHWAIPVPGDETQTIYVWLDALVSYLTAAGYPDERFRMHWPPAVQVIGKDILKFHAIYWPAFLIAANMEPPKQIFVHSHWTVDGVKMSKSKNNIVSAVEAANVYTMEGLRYFLLREGVSHSDGNYSATKVLRVLNSELADTLGNLLSRVCAKNLNPQQVYPTHHESYLKDILRTEAGKRLYDALNQLEDRSAEHYKERNFHMVVDTVVAVLHAANAFFEHMKPWELRSGGANANIMSMISHLTSAGSPKGVSEEEMDQKNVANAQKLETIIAMTMDTLRSCAIVLQPIVPQLSSKVLDKLNVPQSNRLWCNLKEDFSRMDVETAAKRPARQLGGRDAVIFRRVVVQEEEKPVMKSRTGRMPTPRPPQLRPAAPQQPSRSQPQFKHTPMKKMVR